MAKIFSLIKNGKRVDIEQHEFLKMVNAAGRKLSKGGAGSGRYPKGSGEDKPESGKTYALTGAPGEANIAAGNTWKESEVKAKEEAPKEAAPKEEAKGISDAKWNAMIKDPAAKEFVRIHSQILNGGMEQLVSNERGVEAVKYQLREAKDFVKANAPEHAVEFAEIVDEYDLSTNPESRDSNGNMQYDEKIAEAWDSIDTKYYDFYEKMEAEMDKKYKGAA